MSGGIAELARTIYSVGLIVLGFSFLVLIVWRGPAALRTISDLSSAIKLAATGLREVAPDREAVARIEHKVDEIHAALVKHPPKA